MVLMPPGSAKSTYASVLFPAWYLAQKPGLCVIGASHTADLAEAFSGRVIATVREHSATLGYSLKGKAVGAWTTSAGGQYKAAGVGGPITGRRANVAIIDDPVKSAEDANSEKIRDKTWNWYTSDLRTRLKPGAARVLIQTRWHEDDLAGRILQTQGADWTVLKLPATALPDDPLGRRPGELLWADDTYGYAAELRDARIEAEKNGAMREWQALYEQDPRPGEGAIFQTAKIGILDAAPATTGRLVRAWDLAATEQVGTRDPDWTVGVLMQRTPEMAFVVRDVVRVRGGPAEVEAAIVNTARQDGKGVIVDLPQDPGQAGKGQVLYLTRKLVGYAVRSSPETGDKATRAAPYASQVNVGNVSLVQAQWNRAYLDELSGFPSARYDDQVDASSRSFNGLIAPPAPARTVKLNILGR